MDPSDSLLRLHQELHDWCAMVALFVAIAFPQALSVLRRHRHRKQVLSAFR